MGQRNIQQHGGGLTKFQVNDHLLARHCVPRGIAPNGAVAQNLTNDKSIPQAHATSLPRSFILQRLVAAIGRERDDS
jgi:hypothetical protein